MNAAAAAVVCVFETDQSGPDIMHVLGRPDGLAQIIERKQAASPANVRAVTPESRAIPPASQT